MDQYIATVVQNDSERVVERANDLAERLLKTQIGREWDENTAPMLSALLPGTLAGGLTACKFDHPDQHSNGPVSSLTIRMSSLGINPQQNGPNNGMIETSWVTMTKAERLFRNKGNRHVEWRSPHYPKENATDLLVNVYDWVCWPLSLANGLFRNGWLDLSRFPCHQLNGSFNALSALRKTVQWANQWVFESNENAEPIAFVVFTRTRVEAMRRWTTGGAGGNARMKFANYSNRQFTDHISTHEWDEVGSNGWPRTLCERSMAASGHRANAHDCCNGDFSKLESDHRVGNVATTNGQTLVELRLMGHTKVPLNQAIGCRLMQPGLLRPRLRLLNGSNDRTATALQAIAQTANALIPGAEIVLRKKSKGTMK